MCIFDARTRGVLDKPAGIKVRVRGRLDRSRALRQNCHVMAIIVAASTAGALEAYVRK